MIIEVKVFSSLRHYLPDSEKQTGKDKWDVPEGATPGQVIEILNIPEEEVRMLLINGRKSGMDRILNVGDIVHLFPLMSGG